MDYTKLNDTITAKVMAALKLINNPEIDPDIRQLNQEILFREVGAAVYAKVYEMNAFDFEIEYTRGPGIDNRYYGLAKVAAASVAVGTLGLDQNVRTYLDGMTAKAQQDAVTNPGPEVYRRHRECDCSIVTKGFKSRNGQLDNYVKS